MEETLITVSPWVVLGLGVTVIGAVIGMVWTAAKIYAEIKVTEKETNNNTKDLRDLSNKFHTEVARIYTKMESVEKSGYSANDKIVALQAKIEEGIEKRLEDIGEAMKELRELIINK